MPRKAKEAPKKNGSTSAQNLLYAEAELSCELERFKAMLPQHPKQAYVMLKNKGKGLLVEAMAQNNANDVLAILTFAETEPAKYRFKGTDLSEYLFTMIAARRIELSMLLLEQLIKQEKDILVFKQNQTNTLLHIAAQHDNLPVVEKIVKVLENAEKEIEIPNGAGWTPWFIALAHQCSKVIDFLSNRVKNINPVNNAGYAILEIMAANGDLKGLDFLIGRLREKNERIDRKAGPEGKSVLHIAGAKGQIAAYRLLEEHLLAAQEDIDPRDQVGRSVLHTVIANNQTEMVQFLLEKGVSVNARTKLGDTPLHYVIRRDGIIPSTAIAKLILDELVKRDQLINVNTNEGLTPLHDAAREGAVEIVGLIIQSLLKSDETVSPVFEYMGQKRTPFVMAFSRASLLLTNRQKEGLKNYFSILELFLQCPSFNEMVNINSSAGTLLSIAVNNNQFKIVEGLLPRLLNRWNAIFYFNLLDSRDLIGFWGDISLGCMFSNDLVNFRSALNTFPPLKCSYKINCFKEDYLMESLRQAADYDNIEMAKLGLVFLLGYETQEHISSWLQSKIERSNDKKFKQFVSKLDVLFKTDQKKKRNIIEHKTNQWQSKIDLLPNRNRVTSGNEVCFETLKQAHVSLEIFLEKSIKPLQYVHDIDFLNPTITFIETQLSPVLERYRVVRQNFLSEEARLQNQALSAWLNRLQALEQSEVLSGAENYLFSTSLDSELMEQKISLQQKYEAVQMAIIDCRAKIEKYKQYEATPETISMDFEFLSSCLKELDQDLYIFSENLKKHNEKTAYEKKKKNLQEVLQMLENQMQKIESCLKKSKGAIQLATSYGIDNSLTGDDLSFLDQALTLRRTATASVVEVNPDNVQGLHLELCNVAEFGDVHRAIAVIEERINQDKASIENKLVEPANHLKEKTCIKINEIEHVIDIVIGNKQHYERMLQDGATISDEIRVLWGVCKNMKAKLKEFKEIVEKSKKVSTLKHYLIDSEYWLLDTIEKVEILEAALSQYQLRVANDVDSVQVLLQQVSLFDTHQPVLFREVRGAAGRMLCGLTLACEQERMHLKNVIVCLNQPENSEVDFSAKTNALLLSIAIIFEKMKQIGASNKEEQILLKKALGIRNAIFHKAVESAFSQENYEILCNLVRALTEPNLDHRKFDFILDKLADLFPTIEPGVDVTIECIEQHHAYLKQYASSLENNLISKLDFAFRIAHAQALLNDLKQTSGQEDDLNFAARMKLILISEELSMEVNKLLGSARAVRHEGLEAVWGVVEDYCLSLAIEGAKPRTNSL